MGKINTRSKDEELEYLRQRVAELECNYGRINNIFSSLKDLIFILDRDGVFTEFYVPSEELYLPPEEFVGKKYTNVLLGYFDTLISEAFEKNEAGKVDEYEYSLEIAGNKQWYHAKQSPLFSDGQFTGAVAIIRNITNHKQIDEKLRETEARYRTLIELGNKIGEAVIMLQDIDGREGMHTYVSDQWPQITGYSKEELLNMSFFDLIGPKGREISMKRHRQKMAGKTIPDLFELNIVRKDGKKVPVEITSAGTSYEDKSTNVVYIRDITERKEIEANLVLSEEQYKILFENAPISLWEFDYSETKKFIDNLNSKDVKDLKTYFNNHPEKIVEYASKPRAVRMNKYAKKMMGGSVNIVNKRIKGLVKGNLKLGKDDLTLNIETVNMLLKEQNIISRELPFRTFSGRPLYILQHCSIVPGYEKTWGRVVIADIDITELKRIENILKTSEKQLKMLSKRILNAQEEERLNISRELHDQLVQNIVAIRMEISLIRDLSDNINIRKALDLQLASLSNLVYITRNILKDLRPQILDDFGLMKAIQIYAEDCERRTGISFPVNIKDSIIHKIQVRKETEITAYRIVQEVLTNVIRHAKANQAKITVSNRNKNLHIAIKDDGIGMRVKTHYNNSSLGIISMRERASMAGGTIRIISKIGKGTMVVINLPL